MNVYEYLTLPFKFALENRAFRCLLSEIPMKLISLSAVKRQLRIQLGDGTPPPENS